MLSQKTTGKKGNLARHPNLNLNLNLNLTLLWPPLLEFPIKMGEAIDWEQRRDAFTELNATFETVRRLCPTRLDTVTVT